ncbi:MAG: redox-sensing transcriptional repressor Rex [Clostridia bacterium]|nr:redox-sensing transcriptional repressor Rex [Clostridia bacterium]
MKKISTMVIRRLPRYFRYLTDLKDAGVERISSTELAEKMNVTASQIRQDFNCFGGFGQQGYGYNVQQLHKAIADIMGLSQNYKLVIIGAGNLGHALANYAGFSRRGFHVVGMFDVQPDIVGTTTGGITIGHIDDLEAFCKREKPEIAVLTVPKEVALEVAERLPALGIKGVWNFSYMELRMPKGIYVENVHLSASLMTLSQHITADKKEEIK